MGGAFQEKPFVLQRVFLGKQINVNYLNNLKEVIQGHLPVALPCYDFIMIKNPSFDSAFLKRLDYRLWEKSSFLM